VDVEGGYLDRERLGYSFEGEFGRAVDAVGGECADAGDGGDVHDCAGGAGLALGSEAREEGADGAEDAEDVGVELLLDVGVSGGWVSLVGVGVGLVISLGQVLTAFYCPFFVCFAGMQAGHLNGTSTQGRFNSLGLLDCTHVPIRRIIHNHIDFAKHLEYLGGIAVLLILWI